jgi:hypothetical protein
MKKTVLQGFVLGCLGLAVQGAHYGDLEKFKGWVEKQEESILSSRGAWNTARRKFYVKPQVSERRAAFLIHQPLGVDEILFGAGALVYDNVEDRQFKIVARYYDAFYLTRGECDLELVNGILASAHTRLNMRAERNFEQERPQSMGTLQDFKQWVYTKKEEISKKWKRPYWRKKGEYIAPSLYSDLVSKGPDETALSLFTVFFGPGESRDEGGFSVSESDMFFIQESTEKKAIILAILKEAHDELNYQDPAIAALVRAGKCCG